MKDKFFRRLAQQKANELDAQQQQQVAVVSKQETEARVDKPIALVNNPQPEPFEKRIEALVH